MKAAAGRFLKKFLLWAAGLFVVLLLVLAGLIFAVVRNPEGSWRFVQRHFLPADLQVTWAEMHFKFEKVTWLHHNLEWQVRGLQIDKTTPRISAPIDEVEVVLSFSVFRPKTEVVFSKIALHAVKPVYVQLSGGKPEESPEQSFFQQMRGYLDYLDMANTYATARSVDGEIKELVIQPAGQADPMVIGFKLIKPAEDGADVLSANVTLRGKNMNGELAAVVSAVKLGTPEPFLTGKAKFNGFKLDQTADIKAVFQNETLQAEIEGATSYAIGNTPLKAAPKLVLVLDERQAELRLGSNFIGIPGPIARLDKVDFNLMIPLQNDVLWTDQPSRFNINGPVDLFFIDKDMRPPLEKSCKCKIPERVAVKATGQLWLKTVMTPSTSYKKEVLDGRVSVESVRNRLFTADIAAGLKIFKEKAEYLYEPSLDSELHIHSFQGVKNFLDAKNIMVPAPFDVLEGTIDIVAKGAVARDGKSSTTPVRIDVALGSDHQKVKLGSQIKISADQTLRNINVGVSLIVDEFTIELPPLDPIAGMPKLVRDPRVKLVPPPASAAAASKKPKIKVTVQIEAKTLRSGAIRLLTKYADPYVPITVDAQRGVDGELIGSVQLEQFDIKYLRRTVHVEHMRLVMDGKDNTNFPVDGRMRVDQTQYRIFIDVSGTMQAPSIRLTSEPELQRSEIISVLLYDRTSDQLVSADAETAGSVEAAMADRAIGLFGMWALASTPIKSFSYNPVTKVYSATVQLADGLTAGVGTNWEEAAHLEVRKRVSKRWVLTASYAPSETDKDQVGKLVLQWEKRF